MKRLNGFSIKKKKGRRILAVLMALLIMVGMLPLSSLTVFSVGGTLTKDGAVYLIYDKEDLAAFANRVNSGEFTINGKLMGDITLNENVIDISGDLQSGTFVQWNSIGKDGAYTGTFNGNGKVIKGMYIKDKSDNPGLFDEIGNVLSDTLQSPRTANYFLQIAA